MERDPEAAIMHMAVLSHELMQDQDERNTLDRVCEHALKLIPAAEFCGITVKRRRGRLETLSETDSIAAVCDELQYELGEGPCVEAATDDESFLVRSTATDPRWPAWGPRVAELGVHSIVSVQLTGPPWHSRTDPLGAVNLYARPENAFDERDLVWARAFGIHAANALAMARAVSTLGEAVEARHQIGVAQGVLMEKYGLETDRAFDLLQRYSSSANVKVRDVAADVVRKRELPATGVVDGVPDQAR